MSAFARRVLMRALTAGLLLASVRAPARAAEPAGFDPTRSDPKAVAIADQVMQTLGGEGAWRSVRYLRFDFDVERGGKSIVRRAHTWDKWSGRYRLEGRSREGKPYRVVMDLHAKTGTAWLDARALDGDALRKQLDDAYATWVNDTYWLIMPYKMKDPGVTLKLDGERKTAEGAWDKVLLMLLAHKHLSLQDADVVGAALRHFRNRPALSFSDCLVLEVARKAGHLPLGTFDRDLARLPDAQRV